MERNKVCFISDAHFGIFLPGHENRERLFFRLLEQEAEHLAELYIVGDLFDFWIEYRHALRPDYFDVLHHLKMLVDAGVRIHYLAGNHDFALGSFLEKTVGMAIYPGELSVTIQGQKVFLFHGDGLIKSDWGYRLLRLLLRSSCNQTIYKFLHPNIGVPLGNFFSGSSRKYLNKPLSPVLRDEYRRYAQKKLQTGHDLVLYGHIHQPEHLQFPEGIYCNTGAWLKHYTYATMVNGKLSLWRYNGGSPEEIPASLMK